MSAEASKAWNEWAKGVAESVAMAACKGLAKATCAEMSKMIEETEAELNRRDARIAELERRIADLEDMATKP